MKRQRPDTPEETAARVLPSCLFNRDVLYTLLWISTNLLSLIICGDDERQRMIFSSHLLLSSMDTFSSGQDLIEEKRPEKI